MTSDIFGHFLPTYLPCPTIFTLYNIFGGFFVPPLPTLKWDVIYGRSPLKVILNTGITMHETGNCSEVFLVNLLKFVFAKKATKINEIFTVNLTLTT